MKSRLVGDRPDAQWLLSGFGVFLRLVRLNCIAPASYYAALGYRFKVGDNLLFLLGTQGARLERLAGLVESQARPEWACANWLPFKGRDSIAKSLLGRMRYCPSCLRVGVHTHAAQQPWIERCPVHGDKHLDACRFCGRRLPIIAGRGRLLLQCECGHDPIDAKLAVQTRKWSGRARHEGAAEVWAWTQGQRLENTLVGPDEDPTPATLQALVNLPLHLERCAPRNNRTKARLYDSPRQGLEDPASLIERLTQFSSARPTTVALPPSIASRFRQVARAVGRRLPPGTLTARETHALVGVTQGKPSKFRDAEIAIFSLPCFAVSDCWYLDASAIPKTVCRVAETLAQQCWASPFDPVIRDNVGAGIVLRACFSILEQGYAQGIRATFLKHVPAELLATYIARLYAPWAVIYRNRARTVRSVKICWQISRFDP